MKFEFLLKGKLAENGISLAKFAERIETSPQNLTQRLKRGTITYDEVLQFAELLDYDIIWVKRQHPVKE